MATMPIFAGTPEFAMLMAAHAHGQNVAMVAAALAGRLRLVGGNQAPAPAMHDILTKDALDRAASVGAA